MVIVLSGCHRVAEHPFAAFLLAILHPASNTKSRVTSKGVAGGGSVFMARPQDVARTRRGRLHSPNGVVGEGPSERYAPL